MQPRSYSSFPPQDAFRGGSLRGERGYVYGPLRAAITRHFECEQCVLLRSGESRDPCRWITMSRLPAIIRGLFVTIRKKNSRGRRFKRQCRLSETVTAISLLL